MNICDEQQSQKHFVFIASAPLSYILVDEVVLGHAGSEKFLLHLQYRCLLSAQPLLLGILNVGRTEQIVFQLKQGERTNNNMRMQAADFYLDAL